MHYTAVKITAVSLHLCVFSLFCHTQSHFLTNNHFTTQVVVSLDDITEECLATANPDTSAHGRVLKVHWCAIGKLTMQVIKVSTIEWTSRGEST